MMDPIVQVPPNKSNFKFQHFWNESKTNLSRISRTVILSKKGESRRIKNYKQFPMKWQIKYEKIKHFKKSREKWKLLNINKHRSPKMRLNFKCHLLLKNMTRILKYLMKRESLKVGRGGYRLDFWNFWGKIWVSGIFFVKSSNFCSLLAVFKFLTYLSSLRSPHSLLNSKNNPFLGLNLPLLLIPTSRLFAKYSIKINPQKP